MPTLAILYIGGKQLSKHPSDRIEIALDRIVKLLQNLNPIAKACGPYIKF